MNDGVTIRFQAYTGDGLVTQIQIEGQTFDGFMRNLAEFEQHYPQLGSFGILLRDAPTGSLRPQEHRIIGWLRGYTQDSRTGQEKPAVFLYSDAPNLEFSVCTVYEEMLPKLPPSIDWQNAPSYGNAAPQTVKARTSKSWRDCDMRIVMLPQFNYEGKPQLTDSGKPKYKFSHVVGYSSPGTTESTGDAPAAPAPESQKPPVTPSRQQPAQTPAPATQQGVASDTVGHRGVLPEGNKQLMPRPVNGAPRVNAGPGRCPVCNAPQGKLHGTTCTHGLETPHETEHGDNPFDSGTDPLMPYAKAFSDPNFNLSPETGTLISEMRHADKTSGTPLTLTVPAQNGERAVPGQYNLLCGLIDKIAQTNGVDDDEIHNKVLSLIFGSPIRSETAPGENSKVLIDRIYPGSKAKGPNPNYSHATVEAIKELVNACVFLDTLNSDEDYEYAA